MGSKVGWRGSRGEGWEGEEGELSGLLELKLTGAYRLSDKGAVWGGGGRGGRGRRGRLSWVGWWS